MARLWIFNAGHEEALPYADASSYTPARSVRVLTASLYPLMTLLTDPNDYIGALSPDYTDLRILDADGRSVPQEALPRELTLALWADEPHTARLVARLLARRGIELHLPIIHPHYIALSHRRTVVSLIEYLVGRGMSIGWLMPQWLEASEDVSTSREAIRRMAQRLAEGGAREIMVKRPYTSSGRGVMPYDLPLSPEQVDQLVGMLSRSGSISLEPRLSVVDNYALLYQITPDGHCRHVLYSYFGTESTSSTAYSSSYLIPQGEIRDRLIAVLGSASELDSYIEATTMWIEVTIAPYYRSGWVGVDVFSYREVSGAIKLHSAVEVNLRCTMGVLAARAEANLLAPSVRGRMCLAPSERVAPLVLALPPRYNLEGRLLGGCHLLTPLDGAMVAYILVDE